MKVKTQGNTTIIQYTEGDLKSFLQKVTQGYHSYKNMNLVLDISKNKESTNEEVLLFTDLSSKHQEGKKSFVLVISEGFDFNEAPEEIMVVPTLQEAHDIIEMEEIERDLGF